MRKLILGAFLAPWLAQPALAQCEPDLATMTIVCGNPFFTPAAAAATAAVAAAAAAAPPAVVAPPFDPTPCAGLPHGTEGCLPPQSPIFDGGFGSPVSGADVMGFGAAVTAFGVAAVSAGWGTMAAAAMAVGAAAASPMGDAADSGAVGDAAAASAGEGGGF